MAMVKVGDGILSQEAEILQIDNNEKNKKHNKKQKKRKMDKHVKDKYDNAKKALKKTLTASNSKKRQNCNNKEIIQKKQAKLRAIQYAPKQDEERENLRNLTKQKPNQVSVEVIQITEDSNSTTSSLTDASLNRSFDKLLTSNQKDKEDSSCRSVTSSLKSFNENTIANMLAKADKNLSEEQKLDLA